jgi:hypothetical protein
VIGAGISVNGSALVFCGRDMWFVGGRNVCALFFFYLLRSFVEVNMYVYFNKQCILKNIITNNAKINVPHTSPASVITQQKVKSSRLKYEIKFLYKNKNHLNKELYATICNTPKGVRISLSLTLLHDYLIHCKGLSGDLQILRIAGRTGVGKLKLSYVRKLIY